MTAPIATFRSRTTHDPSEKGMPAARARVAGLATLRTIPIAIEAVSLIQSPHGPLSLHNLPGFFGLFGFLAFSFAVLSGWPLGKLLRRPEDYYDTSSGEAGRDR